jgi:PhzF family phenazine biosynthesis protein
MLKFKQVDVFTAKPFLGNPVAVVIGAEGLDTAAMQRIACWTNLSETTFLLKSAHADYKLRIFTPRAELPFAGHPTVGSAHAALESGFVPRKTSLTQECAAGIIPLSVEGAKIFLRAPEARVSPFQSPSLVDSLGGKVANLQRVDVGPVWIVGEVESAEALAAMTPDMSALAAASNEAEAGGVTLFAKSNDKDTAIHVRSFAPAHGINEDPVCGSGNISVAAYLSSTSKISEVGNQYIARQGMQLGRDGRVYVRVTDKGIEVGGDAVTCVDGTLKISS